MNSYKDNNSTIRLLYHKGELHQLEVLKKADTIDFDGLKHCITYFEDDLPSIFRPTKTNATKEKIALFCIGYKAWSLKSTGHQLEYKPTRADAGMLKNIELNENLLRTFLLNEFWTKEKTISNYVKHYNEIKRISVTKVKSKESRNRESLGDAFQRRYNK